MVTITSPIPIAILLLATHIEQPNGVANRSARLTGFIRLLIFMSSPFFNDKLKLCFV